MLQNAILSGTWPRIRANNSKNVQHPSARSPLNENLDKRSKKCENRIKIFIKTTKTVEGSQTSDNEKINGKNNQKLADSSAHSYKAPKLTYDLVTADNSAVHSSFDDEAESLFAKQALLSEEYIGFSFDSTTSLGGDVFDSFDSISDVSDPSLNTEADQLERCLADIRPRKISVESIPERDVYTHLRPSSNCIFDYNFPNGSLHRSFSNVSLAVEPPRAYGVRDLRSETNLNQLKEHIICGQRYKDENSNFLGSKPRNAPNRLSKSETNIKQALCDILIPLNSGNIVYESHVPRRKPRNKAKIFASREELESDFEAMSLDYYESLCYLKQKDVDACRVAGPGIKNGTAGKLSTFYLFTDKDNTKHLKVFVTGPRLVPPKLEVKCLAECFYSVSYLPDRVGWYYINVLWRGKHVKGSPFHVVMLLPKKKVWFKRD